VFFVVGWVFQRAGRAGFGASKSALMNDVSHTLIGPILVVTKMLVRLGPRRDLAPYLGDVRQADPRLFAR
jgi:uncharacterized membrane protein YGL010W